MPNRCCQLVPPLMDIWFARCVWIGSWSLRVSPKLRRDYHQSFVQPNFRTEKERGSPYKLSAYFDVFAGQKGTQKSCAKPWYSRMSGKSPARQAVVQQPENIHFAKCQENLDGALAV